MSRTNYLQSVGLLLCLRSNGTAYLAGLWRSTLLSDLLWRADPVDSTVIPPPKYRAPSWSWASVNCPVKYLPGWIASPEITVIEANAQPVVEMSQFGRVSDGYIRLSGKLIHGMTVAPYRGHSYALQARCPDSHSILAECTPDQPLGPANMQPEIFCLPVGLYIDSTRAFGDEVYVGLVLIAHEIQRRGYYRRWGVFMSHRGWFVDADSQAPNHRYTDDAHGTIVLN